MFLQVVNMQIIAAIILAADTPSPRAWHAIRFKEVL
jgi:hypothetical protein